MRLLCLDDNQCRLHFAPLTLTRPVGDLRIGLYTNSERWQMGAEKFQITYKTDAYLEGKYPSGSGADLLVNACVIPNRLLIDKIVSMPDNSTIECSQGWIAKTGSGENKITWNEDVLVLSERWHLYQFNDQSIRNDFELATQGRTSQKLSSTNTLIGDPNLLFIEEGATIEAAILNTSTGPIYVGKDAEIMEGSIVRGPLAMHEHSVLKLGAKVYGPTTLGPHCKVGGEVNNVIFQAYSNKGHDGFLGNALIGEWCNLGADTNTSNLKNNYSEVSTYSYVERREIKTDIQFMGVCMGDHSKCGINTMFNTATVVGVSCNVYDGGFPDKFIPSFSWGGKDYTYFRFDKAIEFANNMMARRGLQLTEVEVNILRHIADNE